MAADDFAVIADLLDARTHFHDDSIQRGWIQGLPAQGLDVRFAPISGALIEETAIEETFDTHHA
jgi:hypothetical protein